MADLNAFIFSLAIEIKNLLHRASLPSFFFNKNILTNHRMPLRHPMISLLEIYFL